MSLTNLDNAALVKMALDNAHRANLGGKVGKAASATMVDISQILQRRGVTGSEMKALVQASRQ